MCCFVMCGTCAQCCCVGTHVLLCRVGRVCIAMPCMGHVCGGVSCVCECSFAITHLAPAPEAATTPRTHGLLGFSCTAPTAPREGWGSAKVPQPWPMGPRGLHAASGEQLCRGKVSRPGPTAAASARALAWEGLSYLDGCPPSLVLPQPGCCLTPEPQGPQEEQACCPT